MCVLLVKMFSIILISQLAQCERTDFVRNIDIKLQHDAQTLRLEFEAFDKTFLLDLSSTEEGKTQDKIYANDRTSLLLKQRNQSFSLEGVIEDDFLILPSGDDLSHTITEIKEDNLANDYEVPEAVEHPGMTPSLLEMVRSVRNRRSLTGTVRPEILVVVDKSLHHQLGNEDSATNNYVRNFWNAVNLRFRLISNPRVELNIAGIIIGKSSSQTPYLRDSRVSGRKFEARKALDLMGKHFFKSDRSLPVFDLVVTMTNLDMCRYKEGEKSCNKATAGFAYVGGACVVNKYLKKINSVALVEDTGGYSGVIVAAHEVAHLLGAVHDGDGPVRSVGGPGARQCGWREGFIMSDARRSVRGLAWSDCTQAQLSHFLSSPTARCLTNPPHSHHLSLLSDHQPSLDTQCEREMGPGSKACFRDGRVCTQLFCHNPGKPRSNCISYRPALEGSQCGAREVCRDGRCVQTQTAKISSTSTTTFSTSTSSTSTISSTTYTSTPVRRVTPSKSKTAKPKKIKTISADCHDKKTINVRGVKKCHDLFQSFSFAYCGNKYIETLCCASHAFFCN